MRSPAGKPSLGDHGGNNFRPGGRRLPVADVSSGDSSSGRAGLGSVDHFIHGSGAPRRSTSVRRSHLCSEASQPSTDAFSRQQSISDGHPSPSSFPQHRAHTGAACPSPSTTVVKRGRHVTQTFTLAAHRAPTGPPPESLTGRHRGTSTPIRQHDQRHHTGAAEPENPATTLPKPPHRSRRRRRDRAVRGRR